MYYPECKEGRHIIKSDLVNTVVRKPEVGTLRTVCVHNSPFASYVKVY